jgi:Tfp pilus assembly protein PilF
VSARRVAALAGVLALNLCACIRLPARPGSFNALSPEEHVSLGMSYEQKGEREAALIQYQAAVQGDRRYAEGWLALGNLAFNEGRLKDAEKAFRKARKVSPRHAGAANNLAMTILARGGRLAEAEALASEALLQSGPLKPYALDTLAQVYLKGKRYSDARAAVLEAQALAPAGDGVRAQLAATLAAVNAEAD